MPSEVEASLLGLRADEERFLDFAEPALSEAEGLRSE